MALSIQDSIDTVFLDTVHYDVVLRFPKGYAGGLDSIVVHNVSDLTPFTYVDGELKTPVFTIETYVTAKQDKLLQALYSNTMHPGYVDLRYPVRISWGNISSADYSNTFECYLSSYKPPESVDFESTNILSAEFTLRAI